MKMVVLTCVHVSYYQTHRTRTLHHQSAQGYQGHLINTDFHQLKVIRNRTIKNGSCHFRFFEADYGTHVSNQVYSPLSTSSKLENTSMFLSEKSLKNAKISSFKEKSL